MRKEGSTAAEPGRAVNSDTKLFRTFRAPRSGGKVLHIGEAEGGPRGAVSRFGQALCGVTIELFPDGERLTRATCKACHRRFRRAHVRFVSPWGNSGFMLREQAGRLLLEQTRRWEQALEVEPAGGGQQLSDAERRFGPPRIEELPE